MSDPIPITRGNPATGNGNPATEPKSGANASARTAPRASIAPDPATTKRARTEQLMATFTPPDIWSQHRPSLRELKLYGSHGAQAPATGPARGWAKGWSYGVGIPAAIGAYYLAWIAERPSRLFVAIVLYSVLVHTAVGAWLPWPNWLP